MPTRAKRCARSWKRIAFRLRKVKPARAHSPGIIRCNWAPSASPARPPPTRFHARLGLEALSQAMPGWQSAGDWQAKATKTANDWRAAVDHITGRREVELPYEGEVI